MHVNNINTSFYVKHSMAKAEERSCDVSYDLNKSIKAISESSCKQLSMYYIMGHLHSMYTNLKRSVLS